MVAVLMLAGCTSEAPDEVPSAAGFWPVSIGEVAVVRSGDQVQFTDGSRTVPVDVRVTPSAPVVVVPVGTDRVALLAEYGSQLLSVVRLADGSVVQRPCPDCHGLAGMGNQLVTVLSDGSLVVLDADLGTATLAPLAEVPTPAVAEPDPDWTPDYRVLGDEDGVVVVGQLAADGGVRFGPTVVSRYDSGGGLLSSGQAVDRGLRIESSANGGATVLESTYSAGACSSGSRLSVLGERGDAVQLPTADGEMVRDWSWAGDRVVTVSYVNQMNYQDCDYRPLVVHELTVSDGVVSEIPSPGLTRLRVLGGCDVVVALRDLAGQPAKLVARVPGGDARDLGQVDDVLWSAPATSGCRDLAGDVAELAGA
ncbi:hypothetical protein [Klenkia sp. PcliD-1-E]|uniref:hypothetical protein n=1 Tax=Klenkia sp. PcliD-1-E TaxID=2954492 RepID=UPI0020976B1D|nr:hypothetical protein [Klenkia sp. PcliD-1-E]MCO7219368.1 hypothetical protein [Klenkia sp. PcliD-1-E]